MSNKKITQLVINNNPTLLDVFPVVNNGITKQLSLTGLTEFIGPYIDSVNPMLTGGTYNDNTGIITFNYSNGTSFEVTGFTTNMSQYKVYTALLTQSGGDDVQSLSSGAVTKGVTYQISGIDGNFSNVGAPNNNESTFFVAINDEIPNSYGTSELKFNTGAPVVTVLENTIGNIWFTYDGVGGYLINSDGLFVDDKTFVIIGDSYDGGGNGAIIASYFQGLYIIISTAIIDFNSSAMVTLDELLFKTPIEIRVYN
jgi:hypothetical protein